MNELSNYAEQSKHALRVYDVNNDPSGANPISKAREWVREKTGV